MSTTGNTLVSISGGGNSISAGTRLVSVATVNSSAGARLSARSGLGYASALQHLLAIAVASSIPITQVYIPDSARAVRLLDTKYTLNVADSIRSLSMAAPEYVIVNYDGMLEIVVSAMTTEFAIPELPRYINVSKDY